MYHWSIIRALSGAFVCHTVYYRIYNRRHRICCGCNMEETVCLADEKLLSDFVKIHSLPQLVKVTQGFDGGYEDVCISEGQKMKINKLIEADTIVSEDENCQKVYIPKTCDQKVEVLMTGGKKSHFTCTSIAELCETFPKYVRVFPEFSKKRYLPRSFKLALIGITKRRKFLECQNEYGVRICLPMGLQGQFIPLHDGREYSVSEVVASFKLPVIVQFIKSQFTSNFGASAVFNSSLGILKLLDVLKEDKIVYSVEDTRLGKEMVHTIPKSINVTVIAERKTNANHSFSERISVPLKGLELSKEGAIDVLESESEYETLQDREDYMHLLLPNVESDYINVFNSKTPPKTVRHGGIISPIDLDECYVTKDVSEVKTSTATNYNDHYYSESGQNLKRNRTPCHHKLEYKDLQMTQSIYTTIHYQKQVPSFVCELKTQDLKQGAEYTSSPVVEVEKVYSKPIPPKPLAKPKRKNTFYSLT